jgi:hypothetical protein
MARAHLGALQNDSRAELVALASRTRANAELVCEQFGMQYEEDWQQLLNMNLDAIYVLTPDGFIAITRWQCWKIISISSSKKAWNWIWQKAATSSMPEKPPPQKASKH